jgi:hypothetical protein
MKNIQKIKNYARYTNFFNNAKKEILDDIGLNSKLVYETNNNTFNIDVSMYKNDSNIYFSVDPNIKNRNDVKKLNGFMNWINLKNQPPVKINYDDIVPNNIWFIGPNLQILNNYIDSDLLNQNYKLRFYDINIKYAQSFEQIVNKIKSQKVNSEWTFYANPKSYNLDDIIRIQHVVKNNYMNLHLFNFKFPHADSKNLINLQRIYHIQWNTIKSEQNIHKLQNYLYECEKNSNSSDELYINIQNISPYMLNTLNSELHRMDRLNYKYFIKVQAHWS